MSTNEITTMWTELKALVESLDLDVHKNAKGNASAGIRARKGLRQLKKDAAALVKATVEAEKSAKEQA